MLIRCRGINVGDNDCSKRMSERASFRVAKANLQCICLRADDIYQLLHQFHQDDKDGGSNERCPLASNFDEKTIHEMKQSALFVAIF